MGGNRILIVLALLFPAIVASQDEQEQKWFTIKGELKAHYRWSEDSVFPVRFPFPPEFIPRGQTAVVMRTVSPGSSFEVSTATILVDLHPAETISGRVRVNFIDLYNRNPTSTDQTVNVKEAWMQFGRRTEFLQTTEGTGVYLLFGKAPKFERQPDRNMESYGLVSTAFNRFEDLQLQTGGHIGSHVYWRAQISDGNPVFFRDSNALAGDNGNDDLRFPNPELHLNSGFPILYDAEVEDLNFKNEVEWGGGVGLRLQSESGDSGLDLLGFYYQRDLADRVDLRGTFYGGDLDLLDGTGGFSLAIEGRRKEEYGGNLELRWKQLRVFAQGVSQKLAGLKRDGYEVEVVYVVPLPLKFAAGGRQLFPFIQPAFRFSMLDNDFFGPREFPAPSVFWDWKKYDFGVRVGILAGIDATVEYSVHDITAILPVNEDEFLTTLRVRF